MPPQSSVCRWLSIRSFYTKYRLPQLAHFRNSSGREYWDASLTNLMLWLQFLLLDLRLADLSQHRFDKPHPVQVHRRTWVRGGLCPPTAILLSNVHLHGMELFSKQRSACRVIKMLRRDRGLKGKVEDSPGSYPKRQIRYFDCYLHSEVHSR